MAIEEGCSSDEGFNTGFLTAQESQVDRVSIEEAWELAKTRQQELSQSNIKRPSYKQVFISIIKSKFQGKK